jgi:cardiolipin synthase
MEAPPAWVELFREWYWVLLIFAYLGVLITIILENRNPAKSLAYILVLVTLPIIGLAIYYLFGRDYRKRKLFTSKSLRERQFLRDHFELHHEAVATKVLELYASAGDLIKPAVYLSRLSHGELTTGNAVSALINGEEKFPALFKALEQAQHHIHLEYYIVADDDVGRQMADILARKSGEGVRVRVVVDGFGSPRIDKLVRQMREAGVDVHYFMRVHFSSMAQSNYRNHRKIVVVDGRIGFVGGINLDDRYLNNGKHSLFWRDTSLRIEGPAVSSLQLQFLLTWKFCARHEFPLDKVYFPDWAETPGNASLTLAASGPLSDRPYCMETILHGIQQAKQSIRITNPYFIPSDQVLTALQMAAASGVEVELLVPGRGDSVIVQRASYTYLKPLMDCGARVYMYQKGFVHAKTITIDGILSYVGTVNMDIRSFYINFELTALVYDSDLCQALDRAFEEDIRHSVPVDQGRWGRRKLGQRFLDSVCRLLTPIL